MYLEAFLLDNFLMDLLLLRLAAAIAGRHVSGKRLMAGAAAGAAIAWVSLFVPELISLPGKLLTGLLLTLAFPFTGRKAFFHTAASVYGAAFLTGGAAFAAAFCFGEAADNYLMLPEPVRGLLAAAAAAVLLPPTVRQLRAGRRQSGFRCELVFSAAGREYRLAALIDTGNSLADPVSGRPAALVYMPELLHLADIPLPAAGIGGTALFYGFKPQKALVDGRETDLLIAVAETPLSGAEALLPAAAAELSNEKGEAYASHHQPNSCRIVPCVPVRKARLLCQFRRGTAAAAVKGGGGGLPSPPRCGGGSGEGEAH